MYWKYGIAVEQIGLTGAQAMNYEGVVRMQLSWIDETDVGNVLFRAIARTALTAPPPRLAKFNSPARLGYPAHGVLVRPYTGGDCNAQELNAVVSYSPYVYLGGAPCAELVRDGNQNRGLYPQELLFHELVHALRAASGFGRKPVPLRGGLKGYGNAEEFIAIVVTNIFMTDPSNRRADRLGPRREWENPGKLESGLASSLDFFKSSRGVFNRIERFCLQNPWFTEQLAETKATFNPIAAYYHDRDKALGISNSLEAAMRDAQLL